jgi:Ca2+-transporting ATPase
LWWVTGAAAGILAAILAVPPARTLFHFGPLHPDDLAVALGAGVLVLLMLKLAGRVFD